MPRPACRPTPPCPPSPSTASTATPSSPRSCTPSPPSIPRLVAIESIGKSHEGRDIWVLTVTNAATGPAADKPAFWVDGNIHATEVAASAANLYFLHTLVTQYGKDPDVTRALDTRAFYVCPRINPDGAEWALADKPKWIRSSTRPYPHDEDDIEGLTVEDIDGDGRILQMRIARPQRRCGRTHPEQPGLMIRRDPIETGGTYYRVLPEGTRRGLRRLHAAREEAEAGARPQPQFPGELAAGIRAARRRAVSRRRSRKCARSSTSSSRHPNITGGTTFHTWSGVLLRPFEHQPDDEMHAEDLWFYQEAGEKGTELTGYPAISVYHEFRYHPKAVIGGTFDWLYEHLGMYTGSSRSGARCARPASTNYQYIDWFRDHPPEDDLKLYAGATTQLGGLAHVAVAAVRPSAARAASRSAAGTASTRSRNPPPALLERELARFPDVAASGRR